MKIRTPLANKIIKSPSTLLLLCCTLYTPTSNAQLKSNTSTLTAASATTEATVENAILGVWINGVNLEQDAFILNINQKRYIECSILQKGFVDIAQLSRIEQDNLEYCFIDHHSFSSEIDTQKQFLKLNIPTQYMLKQNLSAQQRYLPDVPSLGGFLNYNAYYQDGDYHKQASISTDLNLFWRNMLFTSAHLFQRNEHQDIGTIQNNQRLNTSLSFEFPENLTTLTLGDNVSKYTGLNQSFYFAGLNFGTNFISRPNFTYWNTPSVQGSALTQSTVDLMINGSQAYNARVNPGQYNIDSNIGFSGLGDAQIIVKDILGNTTVQNVSVFVDQRLLRPGLTDYNISIGQLRYGYGLDENDYRDWFGSGYIRRGITASTTLGATVDYSKKLESVGLLWSQYVPQLGLLEVNPAYSHADDAQLEGYTINTEFKRNTQDYSIGLRTQYYSPEFRMLGLEDYTETSQLPQRETQIYLSKNQLPYINNLSLSYIERKFRNASDLKNQQLFNLRTSRSFSKNLFGSLGISYDAESNDDAGFDITLTYNFDDRKHSITFNQYDEHETSIQLNKYSFENTGFDYNIGASRRHDVYSANLSTTMKTNVGELNLQYLQTDHKNYYSANYRGGLVWIADRFDLSKYISNSFALVRLEDQANVDIYSNGSYIGRTNINGEIFSYNLHAYTENSIVFDENQIGIENSFSNSSFTLMPMNQRGYTIDFPITNTKNHPVTFKFVDANQQPLPSGSMVYIDGISPNKYPINSQNLVTVYGLSPQNYSIQVKTSQETCLSQFTLAPNMPQDKTVVLICK